MKVADAGLIYKFASDHADARPALETWLAEVREATWNEPRNVKERYASASFLSDNRVVFNVREIDIGYLYRSVTRLRLLPF